MSIGLSAEQGRRIEETAQKLDIDTVVISNIYNPVEPSDTLKAENNIKRKSGVPVVVAGTSQPDFTLPYFHFINTNDEHDIENITDHLIETHKFTDIHILTGNNFINVSYERVKGYRKSLEK